MSRHLASCGKTVMRSIFKAEVLIYQSDATLDEELLFGKITHFIDTEIGKMGGGGGLHGNEYFPFQWSMIYSPLKFEFNF